MRIFKRVFMLVMALSVAAASGAQAAESSLPFTEELAQAAAKSAYMNLVRGNYGAVVEMLEDAIKPMISEEALAAGVAAEVEPLGAFVEIAGQSAMAASGSITVVTVAQHEAGQAQLTCVFTAEGKLSGVGLANISKAVETADPLPLDLPAGAEVREITLHAGTEKELQGAMVLPEGYDGNTPFVIMVHGSGVSDMDETVGPNKPFRDIAYGLAARGIASVRYDKLHYAHPELATADITVDDEYTDTVLEALAVARATEQLGEAYLLGHSEGGMLTPYLMRKSDGFAGGILLAGTPRQLWELLYDQNLALLDGAPEATVAAAVAQLDAEKEKLPSLETMSGDELRSARIFNMPGPYLKHMLAIDPIALALENNAPLLILQGEEDFQVYADVDFVQWQEGLAAMGDLVTFKSYPGLSHLFMTARGSIADVTDAYGTPDLVDEQVIEDIAGWIAGQQ